MRLLQSTHRPSVHARRPRITGLALLLLGAGSCVHLDTCGDKCAGDFDCNDGFICEARGFAGRGCIAAVECTTDADCDPDELCEERDTTPANNPFSTDSPGKRVCAPCGFGACGAGGSGGEGGGGGSGGQGGAP